MTLSEQKIKNLKLGYVTDLLNADRLNYNQEIYVSLTNMDSQRLKELPQTVRKIFEELDKRISTLKNTKLQIFYANRLKTVAEHLNDLENLVETDNGDKFLMTTLLRQLRNHQKAIELSFLKYNVPASV